MIDTHGHVMGPGYPLGSRFTISAEEILASMEQYQISQIWLSHCSAIALDDTKYNRELYENYVKNYPAQLVGFAALDVFQGADHCRDEIRQCVEGYGFKGIKIHSWIQGFALHHPIMYEVMETAERYHLPVLFHDGTPPYADTSQIAGLAERYPRVPVILGHAGLYDSYRTAIGASQELDNIYLCLVGNTIGSIREILNKVKHEKILFGSDYCFGQDAVMDRTLIQDRLDGLMEAAGGTDVEDILYGNAYNLLNNN